MRSRGPGRDLGRELLRFGSGSAPLGSAECLRPSPERWQRRAGRAGTGRTSQRTGLAGPGAPSRTSSWILSLEGEVESRLRERWSSQQVAARLKVEHPNDSDVSVSRESIYNSLFVARRRTSKGADCLPAVRPNPVAEDPPARLRALLRSADDQRSPAEAEDRAVRRHWEGDLIIGEGKKVRDRLANASARPIVRWTQRWRSTSTVLSSPAAGESN